MAGPFGPNPGRPAVGGVVQRHPVPAALAAAAVILILAAPALAMKLSMPDKSARPGHHGVRQLRGHGPGGRAGFNAPLIVVRRTSGS